MKVELSLKDARLILDDLFGGQGTNQRKRTAAIERLKAGIRGAELTLRPRPWKFGIWDYRYWPNMKVAARVTTAGWRVLTPDGVCVNYGPETGAEGRRCADRALRAYIRRQGGLWEPK